MGQQLAETLGMGAAFAVMSMAFAMAGMVFMLIAFQVSRGLGFMVAGVMIIGFLALSVLQTALTGIYQAAVYRFAQTGHVPDRFDRGQMDGAFIVKS